MSRRGRRGLTPEENELWNKVARQANPMHAKPIVRPPQEIFNHESVEEPAKPIPRFKVGEKATAIAIRSLPDSAKPASIQMDHKSFGKLKRGKLKPESRIDLHGMTVERAHGVLTTFIQDAYARQLRLVLVITGKGKDRDDGGPIPTPRGILKRQVPMWLSAMPLSAMVLQTAEAHLRHGGSGAYYVYLRRRR